MPAEYNQICYSTQSSFSFIFKVFFGQGNLDQDFRQVSFGKIVLPSLEYELVGNQLKANTRRW